MEVAGLIGVREGQWIESRMNKDEEEQSLGKHPEFGRLHEWLEFRVQEEAMIVVLERGRTQVLEVCIPYKERSFGF